MKTVQDYLDLGVEFVKGDVVLGYKSLEYSRDWYKSLGDEGNSWIDCFIKSFAWRDNDGVEPEYSGEIEVIFADSRYAIVKNASEIYWRLSKACEDSNVYKWRPVVLQSESPTTSPREDKQMKPVYTAEMHAKGELPPVGAECLAKVDNSLRFNKYTVMYISNSGSMVLRRVESEIDLVVNTDSCEFKPIIKTIKVNGFDVPSPMGEAPERGTKFYNPSICYHDYFNVAEWIGDSNDNMWLSRGLAHSTESAAIAHAKAMLGIDPNA